MSDPKDTGGKGGGSLEGAGVLQEVFGRVGDLSGLLVVAFVAPVAAGAAAGSSSKMSLLAEVSNKAVARDEQDARRLRQPQEQQLKLLEEISSKLDELKTLETLPSKLLDALGSLPRSLP